jgi:LPXTG-motif cell wall-anchored protein
MSVLRRKSLSLVAALTALVGTAMLVQGGASASAASTTLTAYTATITIPVPPASSYAGTGGGDGWAVALSSTAVYNVFHHSSQLNVACHLQKDASPCWSPAYKTITDGSGNNFATSGQPGVWLDQATGHLFVFATRSSNQTGGVVCIDTTKSGAFSGFTALTPTGSTPTYQQGYSGITNPVNVGSKTYAFNSVTGSTATGAKNRLLCFDQATRAACAGQPFAIKIGSGAVSGPSTPSQPIASIGNQVIVPVTVGGSPIFGCYKPSAAGGNCSGTWPRSAPSGSMSSGAPFPMLTKSGVPTGFCIPDGTDECFNLSGGSVATPPHMTTEINSSYYWNGTAVVIGPRVYVPSGNGNSVGCYDYSASAGCPNFPKTFSNLYLLYTVNPDPYRGDCLWVNADSGTQIQNFDAFNPSQACGQGPIRVLASSVVVDTPQCMPATYTSLQVLDPVRSSYTSGVVHFADGSANSIPGIPDMTLDNTGTANLAGLKLNTANGLPQFLITLTGAGSRPKSVTVKLVWTAEYDPNCVKAGTLATPITTPATTTPTTVTAAATPTTVAPAELPRTGSSSGPTALVGIATVLAGSALLGFARRRRQHSV